MRKTKIICTMGPATASEEVLEKLMRGGMNVARFNFSHGSHEEQKERMDRIKAMREKCGKPVVLCVNKCDSLGDVPPDFYEFYNLGLGDPYPVSSVHGHGTGDLLDACIEKIDWENRTEYPEEYTKVAIIWDWAIPSPYPPFTATAPAICWTNASSIFRRKRMRRTTPTWYRWPLSESPM